MHALPFAISVHRFVDSVGADVGFASLLAVALLVVMYFVHARETATLRERLAQAHERIDSLEARLSQVIQLQSLRAQQQPASPRPAPVPPPPSVAVREIGSALASLSRSPAAVVAATGSGVTALGAPAGLGAPALQSATRLIPGLPAAVPSPPAPAAKLSENTVMVGVPAAAAGATTAGATTAGATTAAATNLSGAGEPGGPGADGGLDGAPPDRDAATAVAERSGTVDELTAAAGQGTRAAGVPATVGATAAATALPRWAPPGRDSGGGSVGRRAAPPSRGRGSRVPRGLADGRERSNGAHQRGGHRALRRLVAIAAGLVLVAAIVFALTRVTAGPSAPSPAVAHLGDSSTAGVFSPQHVVVSVLNGTSIGGLAKDVSDGLTAKGYRQGAITNAAVQTQRASLVSYIDAGSRAHRAANRVAAEHVARDLGLRPTAVHPANRAAIESCASGSGSGTTCRGQVIVTLGTDLATMARNAGTTT